MPAVASQRVDACWTVGGLSRATGLSVRVLRHWEQLGLVTAARTATGHRRHGAAEITRLYRALALRRTGLSLRQIATLLDDEDPDPDLDATDAPRRTRRRPASPKRHRSSGGRNANDAESRSCRAVCAGEVTLTPAPQAILANWYTAESVLSIAP